MSALLNQYFKQPEPTPEINEPSTSLSGVAGAVTRGLAPTAAGMLAGAAVGAPFGGFGAIPGAALGGLAVNAEAIGQGIANLFRDEPKPGFSGLVDQALTSAGVPVPQTPIEKGAQTVASAVGGVTGLQKSVGALTPYVGETSKKVIEALKQFPVLAPVSAAVGSTAEEVTKETGVPETLISQGVPEPLAKAVPFAVGLGSSFVPFGFRAAFGGGASKLADALKTGAQKDVSMLENVARQNVNELDDQIAALLRNQESAQMKSANVVSSASSDLSSAENIAMKNAAKVQEENNQLLALIKVAEERQASSAQRASDLSFDPFGPPPKYPSEIAGEITGPINTQQNAIKVARDAKHASDKIDYTEAVAAAESKGRSVSDLPEAQELLKKARSVVSIDPINDPTIKSVGKGVDASLRKHNQDIVDVLEGKRIELTSKEAEAARDAGHKVTTESGKPSNRDILNQGDEAAGPEKHFRTFKTPVEGLELLRRRLGESYVNNPTGYEAHIISERRDAYKELTSILNEYADKIGFDRRGMQARYKDATNKLEQYDSGLGLKFTESAPNKVLEQAGGKGNLTVSDKDVVPSIIGQGPRGAKIVTAAAGSDVPALAAIEDSVNRALYSTSGKPLTFAEANKLVGPGTNIGDNLNNANTPGVSELRTKVNQYLTRLKDADMAGVDAEQWGSAVTRRKSLQSEFDKTSKNQTARDQAEIDNLEKLIAEETKASKLSSSRSETAKTKLETDKLSQQKLEIKYQKMKSHVQEGVVPSKAELQSVYDAMLESGLMGKTEHAQMTASISRLETLQARKKFALQLTATAGVALGTYLGADKLSNSNNDKSLRR